MFWVQSELGMQLRARGPAWCTQLWVQPLPQSLLPVLLGKVCVCGGGQRHSMGSSDKMTTCPTHTLPSHQSSHPLGLPSRLFPEELVRGMAGPRTLALISSIYFSVPQPRLPTKAWTSTKPAQPLGPQPSPHLCSCRKEEHALVPR